MRQNVVFIVAVLVLITLGVSTGPSLGQQRSPSELVVYTPVLYGPIVERVIGPLMKRQFNVTLVYEDLLSSEIMTKVIAQRGNPEASVACPGNDGVVRGITLGLWERLDRSVVENIRHLAPYAKDKPYGEFALGISGATAVLQYHTGVFKEKNWTPPTSWWDLKDPKYKGRVALTSTASGTAVNLMMFWSHLLDRNRKRGNVDAAFKFVSELVKAGQVHSFPTRSSEVNQLMERGEAWIATQYSEGAWQFEARGAPVSSVTPKEGTMISSTGCAVVKGAPNPKAASAFINLALSAEFQRELATDRWAIPARVGVNLPPQYAKHLILSKEMLGKLYAPDLEEHAEFRPTWHTRWLREIESR
jgi:putative spermidine/putrescine transport system substrate-binding protein